MNREVRRHRQHRRHTRREDEDEDFLEDHRELGTVGQNVLEQFDRAAGEVHGVPGAPLPATSHEEAHTQGQNTNRGVVSEHNEKDTYTKREKANE